MEFVLKCIVIIIDFCFDFLDRVEMNFSFICIIFL